MRTRHRRPRGALSLTRYPGVGLGGASFSPLLTSLVARWSFNELSGTRADSVGNRPLLDVGTNATPAVAGKLGNAADFTIAQQNRLDAGAAKAIPVASGDGFTFCGWLKPGTDVHNTWFDNGALLFTGSPGVQCTDAGIQGNYFQLYVFDASSNISGANTVLNAGAWNFLRCWYDPADRKARLKLNEGATQTNNVAQPGAFSIAGTQEGPSFGRGIVGDAPWMTGSWNEVAWWSRVLTDQEGATLYNGGAGLAWPYA